MGTSNALRISNFSHFSGGATKFSRVSQEAGDPLPLVRETPQADPYPVDALGPTMAAAARAFQAKTQAPMDICANAVLAVAALAGQAHADVQLPTGETKPLSLFLVTVAKSGERKTSVDSLASVPVRQREADLRIDNEAAVPEHQNAHAAWDAERKKVLNDKKLNLDERRQALDRLGPEPRPPLAPILVCHEPTFEGLAKLLANGQPSIGIFASEGGAFIGGHGFTDEAKIRTAAGFSLLWDDGRLTRVRAGEGATALAGKRVALHLQAQPDVAARLFSDAVLADQGFLSRILVIAPDSKQGQRFWRDARPEDDAASFTYVARLNELFRRPMPIREGTRNELEPRPLTFTPQARGLWIAFADEIEAKLGPGNDLEAISGFAAKLPEHAARIAGVLTILDQPDATQIGATELKQGIVLSRHYAASALRLHGASRNHADLIDARKLLDWLHTKWTEPLVSLPDIVQLGPNSTRDTAAAKRLIGVLEEHRHIERMQGSAMVNGKTRREVWRIVRVNHAPQ
jgi:hypothetical protein